MSRLKSRKAIMVLVVVALAAGAAVGFLVLPMVSTGNAANATGGARPSETAKSEANHEPGMMYPIKERVVNLADPGRYLKIEIALEFELAEAKELKGEAYKKKQDEFAKEMTSRRPIIDDIITTVLADKTSSNLLVPEGKNKLREELKDKIGEVGGEHELLNVYFTQFIIQ